MGTKAKSKTRRLHGEEAEIMTADDLRKSREIMAAMRSGTFDINSLVVERPARKPVAVLIEDSGA